MNVASPTRASDVSVSVSPGVASQPLVPRNRAGLLVSAVAFLALGAVAGVVATRYALTSDFRTEKPGTAATEKSDSPSDTVTFAVDKQSAAGIAIRELKLEPLMSRIWRSGLIALHDDRLAHISPIAEGIVREVPVRLGDSVPAGGVLAVIECRELGLAKLEAYKARMALSVEQELAMRSRTTMTNAEELIYLLSTETPLVEIEKQLANKPIGDWRQQLLSAYTRRNQLQVQYASVQSSRGVVSESNLRKIEAEAEASRAAYTALLEELRFQVKNQVRQAELKLKEAETALDICKSKLMMFGLSREAIETLNPITEGPSSSLLEVKAPFAGTIVDKHAVRSERVGPQSQLFVLADLSSVWVQAELFDADLPLIRGIKHQAIPFRSAITGLTERSATIVYPGDLIDKSSRTLRLTAEAANPDRMLKPGMFVEVGFDTGDDTPTLHIPAASVLRHENKAFVFVKVADDRFQRVDVVVGRSAGDEVAITSGLKPGDRVVVRGSFVLKSELLKDQMVGE